MSRITVRLPSLHEFSDELADKFWWDDVRVRGQYVHEFGYSIEVMPFERWMLVTAPERKVAA